MDKDRFFDFCDSLEQKVVKLDGCTKIADAIAIAAENTVISSEAFYCFCEFLRLIQKEMESEVTTAYSFLKELDSEKTPPVTQTILLPVNHKYHRVAVQNISGGMRSAVQICLAAP